MLNKLASSVDAIAISENITHPLTNQEIATKKKETQFDENCDVLMTMMCDDNDIFRLEGSGRVGGILPRE